MKNAAQLRQVNRSYRAYLSQLRRIQTMDVPADPTISQATEITFQRMALPILYVPTVSEALARSDVPRLAKYNDMLIDTVAYMPQKYFDSFIPVLRGESGRLNNYLGHSSEISAPGVLEGRKIGVSAEIATMRALIERFDVEQPGIESDLKGIDLTVGRQRDSAKVHVDVKNDGNFKRTVEKICRGKDTPEYESTIQTGYLLSGYDENNVAKYLLNAAYCGEVPQKGFDFTERGVERTQMLVNQILDEQKSLKNQ